MADIAFRSAARSVISSATESPVITAPAGLADGDLILVAIITETTNAGNETLAGWTRLTVQNQASDASLFVLLKIASSEGASWTFTNLFSGTEQGFAYALAYTGVHATTQLDVAEVTGDLGTISTPTDTASITPTTAGCMIVSIFGADNAAAMTGTPDDSPACTERADDYSSSIGWLYIQDHLQTTAVAEAHAVTPSAEEGICYKIIALRPADGAPPAGIEIFAASAYSRRHRG